MSKLKSIRDALGFTSSEVTVATGWTLERLTQIELVDDLDDEAEIMLTDLYGVDMAEALASEDVDALVAPVVELLKGTAGVPSAESRFLIAETVTVARTVRYLQALMEEPPMDTTTPESITLKRCGSEEGADRDSPARLNPAALAAGVSPLRAGALLDHLFEAHRIGRISEAYVRGALRVDLLCWQTLRRELGFPAGGTWTAQSALPDAFV